MVGRRLISLFIALLMGAVLWPNGAVAGPNLPPAPYEPLPVDADRDVQTNWISNSDVTATLRAIRAKHIMVVADSCYAGTLVRSAGVRLKTTEARAAWIERMAAKRSRTALVSGGLEPVADSGGGTG